MVGQRLTLRTCGTGDFAGETKKPGRFKCWVRKNVLPMAAGAAFLACIGSVEFSGPEPESPNVSLYKKGKIDKSRLSLDDKIKAWSHDLDQGWRCGKSYPAVLAEIREEQARLIRIGDNEGYAKLVLIERLVMKSYEYHADSPSCKAGGSR
jgi:hypothetical protein